MRTTTGIRPAAIRMTAWGAVLAVALTGCSTAGTTAPGANDRTISGIVTDSTGAPVEGAQVDIIGRDGETGMRIATDGDGRYAAALPDGTYDVVVADTDSIDEPSSDDADSDASGDTTVTLASTTSEVDHGENVMIGEVVVEAESTGDETVTDIELPETVASDFSDPDKIGGRVALTFTQGTPRGADEQPVGTEKIALVRIVPTTAISREDDVAAVPEPRTVELDENGTAATDLETDQIIGMDVHLLNADGEVFEIIPITKPEGDLTVTINLDSSEVSHANTSTGVPTEDMIAAANDNPDAFTPGAESEDPTSDDSIQEEGSAGEDRPKSKTPLGFVTRTQIGSANPQWTFEDKDRPLEVGQTSKAADAYLLQGQNWVLGSAVNAPGPDVVVMKTQVSLSKMRSFLIYNYRLSVDVAAKGAQFQFTDATGDTYGLLIMEAAFHRNHFVNFNSKDPKIVKYAVK